MKKIYKKIYDTEIFGILKETFFGWEWSLLKTNENISIKKGFEKYLVNAISLSDQEYQEYQDSKKILQGWTLVKNQVNSHDNSDSSV